MTALSDPTTELSSAGPALPCGAAEAINHAEARGRLIQQVVQLLRESGHTEAFDAAACLDRLIGAMAAGSYL
ncbi:MAG: hypothetical protein VKN56_07570 [Cyanobacteriota bacterium]|nr:hypothetical protein [Cyanobacteriota bacterium]